MLNEAANLKSVHESIETLKKNYLIYKRNTTGETKNVFEKENSENQAPNLNRSALDFLK